MTTLAQPQHDLSAIELDVIESNIYAYNRNAVGRDDARGLGFVIRDEAGRIVGVATGYSWAGTSELKQMWVDEAYRGRGYARELLNAFAVQAPGMYEKMGFVRVAEIADWPEGHSNAILCRTMETITATL